jgi:hypothetical protein
MLKANDAAYKKTYFKNWLIFKICLAPIFLYGRDDLSNLATLIARQQMRKQKKTLCQANFHADKLLVFFKETGANYLFLLVGKDDLFT